MRVTSVTLESIKSYSRATIGLSPGLNAVCGLNGSGKTTVLEAIGFALFDYLPYNQQAFVREGEKSGTVRVRLLAHDGREYEVARRVGSGSTYYVADVETGMRLAEKSANVLDWIRTHALGIDGVADLEALFRDAVGVPQGSMTADFQRTYDKRKGVFDPLLRVQEYREAFEGLRETVSHIRDLSGVKREEIAALESETKQIPAKKDEQAALTEQVRQSEARLARLDAELRELDGEKAVLDQVADGLDHLQRELSEKRANVLRHTEMLALQQGALDSARRARLALKKAEPGYRSAVAAKQRLSELEVQRRERDNLERQLAGAQTERQGIFGRIESLDLQIKQARIAAEEAATLVDAVARQGDLDQQLKMVQDRLRGAEKLDEEIAKVARELAELERAHDGREARLSEARAAQDEASRLAEAPDRLREIGEKLAALKPLEEQAAELKRQGQALREQHDRLAAEIERRAAFLRQVDEKASRAAELEALLTKEQEAREERVRIAATIEYQNVARADLGRRHCPLLELECPVVAADDKMLDRFGARVELLAERLTQLDQELAVLSPAVAAARTAAVEVQDLRMQAAQLDRSQSQLDDVAQRLDACRTQYRDLSDRLNEEGELRRSRDELRDKANRLQTAHALAAQLTLLEEQQEHDRRRLEAERLELKKLKEQRAELQGIEQEAHALEEELQALGDPRRKQQDLLVVARRLSDLEASVAAEQKRLATAADKVKALSGQLEAFSTLDADYDQQGRIEQENSADYERFVANRDEAGQLEERERIVAEATQTLQETRKTEADLRKQLEEISGRYDADRHGWLKEQCTIRGQKIAAENKNNEHLLKSLSTVEEELAYLGRQEEKLLGCRSELEELERINRAVAFIRETIKAAGPAITETLLTNISQVANDIYAEIMDDHAVELRWDRDYDVLVQRGAEIRRFAQLSGGEQMSAALAVRLALLKEMSEVQFAFFDEPTQNMDGDRRTNLADQIRAVRGFDQLIVISHDDTFEHHTDNLIRLRKVHEETEVEAG